MTKFIYKGPVMSFGKCVSNCWEGETMAETEQKAKSNLAYQYKKKCGLCASAKVTLPGDVKQVG